MSNVALLAELDRLRYANGVLRPEACPTRACENNARSVSEYPQNTIDMG